MNQDYWLELARVRQLLCDRIKAADQRGDIVQPGVPEAPRIKAQAKRGGRELVTCNIGVRAPISTQ